MRPAIPPSDGDCHTPLPCEVRKGTIPHQERAVFIFKEGRIPVASPLSCCPRQTFGLRLRLNQPTARTAVLFDYLIVATPALRLTVEMLWDVRAGTTSTAPL